MEQTPTMGGDPNMGSDPAMGDDPAFGSDPNMGSDPAMGDDPNMGGDPAMGDDPAMDSNDSTVSIINKLSDEDREAVRAYAESMLTRNSDVIDGEEGSMDQPSNDEPMMESAIFTKKQLKMIMENFGPTEDELRKDKNEKPLSKKKEKSVSKKSPFNSPKFK